MDLKAIYERWPIIAAVIALITSIGINEFRISDLRAGHKDIQTTVEKIEDKQSLDHDRVTTIYERVETTNENVRWIRTQLEKR